MDVAKTVGVIAKYSEVFIDQLYILWYSLIKAYVSIMIAVRYHSFCRFLHELRQLHIFAVHF